MKKNIIILIAFGLALTSCAERRHINILTHRGFYTQDGAVAVDENSLTALQRAQEAGVDAVEFDVHMTLDSQLVVRHDAAIKGSLNCQRSLFDDIRAYRLPYGSQIPSLHEWLEQASQTPQIKMFLELKPHKDARANADLIRLMLAEIRSLGMLDQMRFLSFSTGMCDELLRQEPAAKVVYNSSDIHDTFTPDTAKERGYAGVSYNSAVWINHPQWAARSNELGLDSFFWMTNDGYALDIARDLGCTWVTTDYYDIINSCR